MLAVVVLYGIHSTESPTVMALKRFAVDPLRRNLKILIYDNSFEESEGIEQTSGNIIYIRDPSNPGIGKACNMGCKIARELGREWLLLLDQDTRFDDSFLLSYWESMCKYPKEKLFVPILRTERGSILSPCRFILKRGFALQHVECGVHPLGKIRAVNSGMMVFRPSFEAA